MDTIVTVTGTMIVKGLAAGYGEEELFAGLDLVVAPGDVIGLVGANGAGKSTLLRTLAGLHDRQGGTIAVNPPTALIGYLPQEPERCPGETVAGYMGRRTGGPSLRSRWMRRPPHWRWMRPARTTRTRSPWSTGSILVARTWRAGRALSARTSDSVWRSSSR